MSQSAAQNPAQSNNPNGDAPPTAFGPDRPDPDIVHVADRETLKGRLESYYANRKDLLKIYEFDYLAVVGMTMKLEHIVMAVLKAQYGANLNGRGPRVRRDDKATLKLVCNFFADERRAKQMPERILEAIDTAEAKSAMMKDIFQMLGMRVINPSDLREDE